MSYLLETGHFNVTADVFHYAVGWNFNNLEILFEYKPSLSIEPIHYGLAVMTQNLESLGYLLNKNEVNEDRMQSILIHAIEHGKLKIIIYLVEEKKVAIPSMDEL